MDENIYKIVLAGLLHDVGKLAERAGMEIGAEYERNNAGLYQPFHRDQGRHTHRHALYSAAFIERFSCFLPDFSEPDSARSGNTLINLAAMHHKPETPLQWIITQADRLSSGFDRQVFEGDDTGTAYRDFRKTRLIPLAEEMMRDGAGGRDDTLAAYHWRYRLDVLAPEQVFPVPMNEAEPSDNASAGKEYAKLFGAFISDLEKLAHRGVPELWLEHCVSLLERFTTSIPAATVGKVIPDVSLYDHSRATAALASALYLYHRATNSLKETAIKAKDTEKFVLINGDFYGIQKFIFSSGGSTNRAAAKLLRGRSFAVSLLAQLAADHLRRELGLPITSVLLDAAGKFTMIAPNLPGTFEGVNEVENRLNNWLLERYYGEVSIGFSAVTASPEDFEQGAFPALWERLGKAADLKKYRKFQISKTGVVGGYLDNFDNRLSICPFCGKRPASPETIGDTAIGKEGAACLVCRDHIHLGSSLIKARTLAVLDIKAVFSGNRLKDPIFGRYQVSFDMDRSVADNAADKGLLARMLALARTGEVSDRTLAVRHISGYAPVYTPEDEYDDRYTHGRASDAMKLELIEMIREGGVKSFQHIAKASLVPRADGSASFGGIEALGILKADVDNLGRLFACGLPVKRLNLSRLATFSRQLNSFFALYLPHLLSTDSRFRNIYTVFAGGDDLFLIGPWNRIVEFAEVLRERFTRFACENPRITISAGITVNKPGVPVPTIAEQAEEALEASKGAGRNRLTLFGETVTWPEFRELLEKRDMLEQWREDGVIGKAFLYRLNELIGMAKEEKRLFASKRPVSMSDMACLGWRSRLTYCASRNVGKGLDKATRMAALDEILGELPVWLHDFDGKLKIALWQILYNQRQG